MENDKEILWYSMSIVIMCDIEDKSLKMVEKSPLIFDDFYGF